MDLFSQFQTFIGSIVLGFIFALFFSFFNRLFFKRKHKIIRFILETCLFCSFSYLFYVFLSRYYLGVFNLFFVVALFLGWYLFYKYYAYYFEVFYEKIFFSLSKAFLTQKLKIKTRYDKLFKRRKKHGKVKQNK